MKLVSVYGVVMTQSESINYDHK